MPLAFTEKTLGCRSFFHAEGGRTKAAELEGFFPSEGKIIVPSFKRKPARCAGAAVVFWGSSSKNFFVMKYVEGGGTRGPFLLSIFEDLRHSGGGRALLNSVEKGGKEGRE